MTSFQPTSSHSRSHSNLLHNLRIRSQPSALIPSTYTSFTPSIISRLDRISTLGSYNSATEELVGHSGCVNALDWNQDGHLLATGSDDRTVILWEMGTDQYHSPNRNGVRSPSSPEERGIVERNGRGQIEQEDDPEKDCPKIGMGVKTVIETGHRANIFSIKFAPQSSSTKLFTAAGDRQVRVFDLNSGFPTQRTLKSGSSHQVYSEESGTCVKIFRCHRGRVKRIATEFSPETFLTCGEEGDVRQVDLRLKHECDSSGSSRCPTPLVSFPFSLYSISVSKLSPWLFVAAGTSPYAYLQDRRMIPSLLKKDWGMRLDENDEGMLTKCVRRFGIPEDGFGDEEEEDEESEEDDREKDGDEERLKKRKRREARAKARFRNSHVTAAKLSSNVDEELILSYSSDAIYRFKLSDPPGEDNRQLNFSSRTTNRQSQSDSHGELPSDPNSTRLNHLREELLSSLFPRSNPLSTAQLQDLRNKLVEISALQKAEKKKAKSRHLRFDEQETSSSSTSIGSRTMESIVSLALCEALVSLEDTPIQLSEAQMILAPMSPYSDSVEQIISILEEEAIHALDWESRAQMNEILDRIWELAEKAIRTGWNEDRTRLEDKEEEEMEVDVELGNAEDEETGQVDIEEECSNSESQGEEDADEEVEGEDAFWTSEGIPAFGTIESSSEISTSEEEDSDQDGVFARASLASTSRKQSKSKENFSKEVPNVYPRNCFKGHRNIETVKDVNFLGNKDQFILSGSDDGNFFIYDKETSEVIGIFEGDSSVVNVMQPHPSLPLIAISGIDDTPRIFGPIKPGGKRLTDKMREKNEIVRKNLALNRTGGDGAGGGLSTRRVIQFLQQQVRDGEVGEGEECVIA